MSALDGPAREWSTGKPVNPRSPYIPTGKQRPKPGPSEEAQAITAAFVEDLAAEQAEVQERLDVKSVGQHMAEAEAGGVDFLADPAILARARQISPTPQQQQAESVYRDEQIRLKARQDAQQAQSFDPHEVPITDFVEDDFGGDEELESAYQAIDSAVDSWTDEDMAEYERLQAEQGAVSNYQQEQEDAA